MRDRSTLAAKPIQQKTDRFQGKLAVIIGATGPYHIARLTALHRLLEKHGCQLALVLRNGRIAEYPWFADPGALPFEVVRAYNENDTEPQSFRSGRLVHHALSELKPDSIAFGMPSMAYLGPWLWGVKRGIPMVLFSESKLDDAPRKSWKERAKREIYGRFDAAIVGGPPHIEYAASFGIDRSCCFPGYDAVDNEHFRTGAAEARRRRASYSAQFDLPSHYWIAANRFVPKKNLPRLLEAYARYRVAMGEEAWKLVLMGDGPDKGLLLEKRKQLGLENHIILPGLIPYETLPIYYGLASAFVHASTTEQWGLVVNEAMASRLPILISKTCGCASVLLDEGHNGASFYPEQTESICQAFIDFHRTPVDNRVSMGLRSEAIVQQWGPDRFATSMWSALNSKRPPK
ncbi:glycosyltransferase [Allorhodopirellula heiligendammensis]|uniref:Alpha-monoglucosyldiacylglycerol synthase n=1 Tax=Allorhodopirellula heiligendammensis TaxID=2714739 RepID=A0A5C6BXH4_9BACT|nr:glycosyltransferase [Allorhodopirellula heiligendammensis]TWU16993.1 Alpha-monoglucosyldiacylglycerol synthase [Allorhodopirellula heiligendammensis]